MTERDNTQPETPAHWDQYSRLLGGLPARSLPTGADGRLVARLSSCTTGANSSRPWRAGAMAIAAGTVAVIAGLSIFSIENAPVKTPRFEQTTQQTKSPRKNPIRRQRPRPTPPQITSSPSVDTTPPSSFPYVDREHEATTGGDRTQPRGGSMPGVPPHQSQSAP